ncbi:MAG: rRNA maturation RNase YbeY [Bacteroidetes bacterium]|nr:MAG: rRNA maturation RNase YbeY [Bacteroidota bacterium]
MEFVYNEIDQFPFPEDSLRKWILAIIHNEKKDAGELNFIFCDDAFVLDMNKQYLEHDTFTDIITFDYSVDFGNISGDIYISVDMVRFNAEKFQNSFLEELSRVMAHGVLHIIGYKDKSDEETEVMREKENYYLKMADYL